MRIHDEVIQPLHGVGLTLGAEEELTPAARQRCSEEITRALRSLRAVLRDEVVHQPPASRSLNDEIGRLRAEGVPLHVEQAPFDCVPRALEPLFCSVLAEAARNACKHGAPSSVAARIYRRPGRVVLVVVNDGAGPARPPSDGLGLVLAACAADEHRGYPRWGPTGEDGWRVRLSLPTMG